MQQALQSQQPWMITEVIREGMQHGQKARATILNVELRSAVRGRRPQAVKARLAGMYFCKATPEITEMIDTTVRPGAISRVLLLDEKLPVPPVDQPEYFDLVDAIVSSNGQTKLTTDERTHFVPTEGEAGLVFVLAGAD